MKGFITPSVPFAERRIIDMEEKPIREIISVVFKAVTLAMGVAVVVLSCMGSLEPQTAVTLLGIGLACAGAAMLSKQ